MSTSKTPHGNTGNRNAAGKRVPAGQGRVGMQISVTPQQRDEIKRQAAMAGQTVSEWLLGGKSQELKIPGNIPGKAL